MEVERKYTVGLAGSMHKPTKVSLTWLVDEYDQCGWSKSCDRRLEEAGYKGL